MDTTNRQMNEDNTDTQENALYNPEQTTKTELVAKSGMDTLFFILGFYIGVLMDGIFYMILRLFKTDPKVNYILLGLFGLLQVFVNSLLLRTLKNRFPIYDLGFFSMGLFTPQIFLFRATSTLKLDELMK